MKISSDKIGNRTRGLPVCSAVPQPTEPPRAPTLQIGNLNEMIELKPSLISLVNL